MVICLGLPTWSTHVVYHRGLTVQSVQRVYEYVQRTIGFRQRHFVLEHIEQPFEILCGHGDVHCVCSVMFDG